MELFIIRETIYMLIKMRLLLIIFIFCVTHLHAQLKTTIPIVIPTVSSLQTQVNLLNSTLTLLRLQHILDSLQIVTANSKLSALQTVFNSANARLQSQLMDLTSQIGTYKSLLANKADTSTIWLLAGKGMRIDTTTVKGQYVFSTP